MLDNPPSPTLGETILAFAQERTEDNYHTVLAALLSEELAGKTLYTTAFVQKTDTGCAFFSRLETSQAGFRYVVGFTDPQLLAARASSTDPDRCCVIGVPIHEILRKTVIESGVRGLVLDPADWGSQPEEWHVIPERHCIVSRSDAERLWNFLERLG